jgi:hypothetical protein
MIDLLEMKRRLARAITVLGQPTAKKHTTGELEPVEEEQRYA